MTIYPLKAEILEALDKPAWDSGVKNKFASLVLAYLDHSIALGISLDSDVKERKWLRAAGAVECLIETAGSLRELMVTGGPTLRIQLKEGIADAAMSDEQITLLQTTAAKLRRQALMLEEMRRNRINVAGLCVAEMICKAYIDSFFLKRPGVSGDGTPFTRVCSVVNRYLKIRGMQFTIGRATQVAAARHFSLKRAVPRLFRVN